MLIQRHAWNLFYSSRSKLIRLTQLWSCKYEAIIATTKLECTQKFLSCFGPNRQYASTVTVLLKRVLPSVQFRLVVASLFSTRLRVPLVFEARTV